MRFTDFLAAQLRAAGVPKAPPPSLKWLDAQVGRFFLPESYIVFVAGCSPDAPDKRWPPHSYADLAHRAHERGLACVAVGTDADTDQIAAIKKGAPDIVDLSGQTNLFELAGILRRAIAVVGNDTGPLHMAAALGAPTLALFSGRSNPVWSEPPGAHVVWRQRPKLADLSVDEVWDAFLPLLQDAENESRQSKSRP
jgi:ADP-heptose:LPS heptosyltransferase